jgi:hypothetical protein
MYLFLELSAKNLYPCTYVWGSDKNDITNYIIIQTLNMFETPLVLGKKDSALNFYLQIVNFF